MKRFVVLEKNIGETPLEAVRRWKSANLSYNNVPASYAGRLDPMASGKLLILLGDECKRQRAYTNLDKEYEIEVLLSIGSDTGDVLGIPEHARKQVRVDEHLFAEILRQECGAHIRAYPAFSSKTVGGKHLFLHTLSGTLSDIKVPEHVEHIYRIRQNGSYAISSSKLETKIFAMLDSAPRTDEPSKRLGKNFRIDEIREHWKSLFKVADDENFTVLRLRVVCASGTYMRSLAGRIGTALGTKAIALSIKRTMIGAYVPIFGTGFWIRTY